MTFAVLGDCVSQFLRKVCDVAPDSVMWASIGDHPPQEIINEVWAKLGKLGCQRSDAAETLSSAVVATNAKVERFARDRSPFSVTGRYSFDRVSIDA
jgi:hypothetical protein